MENLAATITNTKTLFDEEFNREIIYDLNDYSIIHFATHAKFLLGKPEDSYIAFGDGTSVTLREIESWTLDQVDLVVLSACETGIGGFGNGEEILGLGYQMQQAKARAVIASLWSVGDQGTPQLMTKFYQGLQQENMTKIEALQQAQIAMIEKGGQFAHPYFWSAFFLIGNGM